MCGFQRKTIKFYRIIDNEDGTVDVWLTPGEAVPMKCETGMDYNIRLRAVRGVRMDDPRWNYGLYELEMHIREHYDDWLRSAEVIEI